MAATKSNMKQRSFYMDDETYALIEKHAEMLGSSKGTALRMIVRAELLGAVPEPTNLRGKLDRIETSIEKGQQATTEIALPPDNQETFPVPAKFRDRGGPPRPQHEDDDF